jgi:hypothetical protein
MHATDIVAYTFQADTFHPDCVLPLVKSAYPLDYPIAATIETWAGPEDILRTVAKSLRIDSDDEHTFDSGDFPKVVFASQVDDSDPDHGPETCGACHERIIPD